MQKVRQRDALIINPNKFSAVRAFIGCKGIGLNEPFRFNHNQLL
ncbi:hypothetical protein [Chelatococcus sp. YT9]|nr:hypothetical protein [Chelatococcus sp. YT9]